MSQIWNYQTFSELMRTDGFRRAFEYRKECTGEPIPYEHLTDEEKEVLNNHKVDTPSLPTDEVPENTDEVVTTSEDAKKTEYTVDEVKVKLKEAGIKFHHMSGPEKIMQIAIENNII